MYHVGRQGFASKRLGKGGAEPRRYTAEKAGSSHLVQVSLFALTLVILVFVFDSYLLFSFKLAKLR